MTPGTEQFKRWLELVGEAAATTRADRRDPRADEKARGWQELFTYLIEGQHDARVWGWYHNAIAEGRVVARIRPEIEELRVLYSGAVRAGAIPREA